MLKFKLNFHSFKPFLIIFFGCKPIDKGVIRY